MDGTRDRPPGKSAENWSRKDGIRAGAVTGPWRSAPRDPPAPIGSVGPRPAPAAAAPAGGSPVEAAARRAPAGGRKTVTWGWMAIGALAAITIAALGMIFRPVTEAPAEVPAAAAPAPAEPMAEADPAPLPADPALRGVSIVRLRVGQDFPPERQLAILAALEAAGITAVRVEALPFEIASSRVGYYRTADLAAAEALGRVVAPVIAEGGEVGVRDYSELLDDAEPGRLDLWVGG